MTRSLESAHMAAVTHSPPGPDPAALDNPYWGLCAPLVATDPFTGIPTVGGYPGRDGPDGPAAVERWMHEMIDVGTKRHDWVRRYAWTITDPATVAFVADHAAGRLLDPMAGTGYWGYLLAQLGTDVLSYDEHPPAAGLGANHWHRDTGAFTIVMRGDAADVAAAHGHDRTLLLAWPPYDQPDAARALAAYTGDRVIYIGEGSGGCTGDDALHAALGWDRYDEQWENIGPDPAAPWVEVDDHTPVQWHGIHDRVHVYNRRTRVSGMRALRG